MGKLWSGFRTLADGCRRLFKKNPDAEKERNYIPEESTLVKGEVRENVLDPQIEVKVFSDKGEVSKAQVDIIIRELQEFQAISGIPKEEPNESKVKSTLLLQSSVNIEDVSNICSKLLRLCRSKIQDDVASYHINVTLFLTHSEPKHIIPTYTCAQAIDELTDSDIEVITPEPSEIQNCFKTHSVISITDSHPVQISERETVNIQSKSDKDYSVAEPITQIQLEAEKADIGEVALTNGHKNKESESIKETPVQKGVEDIVSPDMESTTSEETHSSEPEFHSSPKPHAKPNLKPNSKPNPKPNGGGKSRGIDADVVMARLSRVLRNTNTCSSEFIAREGTKLDTDYLTALIKSFNGTGIANRVRDEISGLKSNNTVWLEQKFACMKKTVKLLSYVHKLEFYALHEKFPELVSFADYVRSKEKQLKSPDVRRKYIALILYGSLIKEKCFEEKFPDSAKEIRKLQTIKQYIQFCLANKDPRFHSNTCKIHKMQKLPKSRKKKTLKMLEGETKPEERTSGESDQTNCQQVPEEVMDESVDDSGDLKKSNASEAVPGNEGNSGNHLDQSEYVNSELHEGANSEEIGDTKEDGEGNRVLTKTELRRKDLSHENWTFEKDAIKSLDDRIRTKRYGKGAKKRFQEQKVKVKTRGVANRHIAPLKQEILTEDAPELSTGDDIYRQFYNVFTDHGGFENSTENINETNKSKENSNKTYLEKGLVSEPDFRHVESAPSTIIVGKKNECEDLGERYGSRESYAINSNKSRRQRKKQQRANKVFTLGNLNNSALVESDSDDLIEDSESDNESDESANEFMNYMYEMFSEVLARDCDDADDSFDDGLCSGIDDFFDEFRTTVRAEPRIRKEKNMLFSFY